MEHRDQPAVRHHDLARSRPASSAGVAVPEAMVSPVPAVDVAEQTGVGRPSQHSTAGAARVATVVALQRAYGNAHVTQKLQSATLQRAPQPKTAPPPKTPAKEWPPVTWSVHVVKGPQAPGIARGQSGGGHKIYKGDSLVLRATYQKIPADEWAKLQTNIYNRVTDSSAGTFNTWDEDGPDSDHEAQAWSFTPTKVGGFFVQVGFNGQGHLWHSGAMTMVVADLQDFSLACTQALADVVSKFSDASSRLNTAAKAYHEAYVEHEAGLSEGNAKAQLTEDLLFGAMFAALGGFHGGTVGGFMKKVKDTGPVGEGYTDMAKDFTKFAVRSSQKLVGGGGSLPRTSGDSTDAPGDPTKVAKGPKAPAGKEPFEFMTKLAASLAREQSDVAAKLRDLIGDARKARDANSKADFDEDPMEIVKRDKELEVLTRDLKVDKKDYLKALWRTWLENHAYGLLGPYFPDYKINRKLKKQINKAAESVGEDGDEWIEKYAPVAREKVIREETERRSWPRRWNYDKREWEFVKPGTEKSK